jgi:hypothetical protein
VTPLLVAEKVADVKQQLATLFSSRSSSILYNTSSYLLHTSSFTLTPVIFAIFTTQS